MKQLLKISIGIVAFIISFSLIRYVKKSQPRTRYTIGILQTASHPALDAAREGFIENLSHKMAKTVTFEIHNAQGSVAHAHAIAQQLHASNHYDAFFAIATPAAQALSAIEKEKPIIIAAVTDPHALGLIHPTTNVCGVTDMIDINAEIDMLTQLVPDAQTIGIIYSAGETNSIAAALLMRNEIEKRGLTALDFVIGNESDIPAVIDLACRKSDVLLAPTDNMIASSINLLTSITLQYKKPLILSDNMLVAYGALAARGVDFKMSGAQAADIAHMILIEGAKPNDLPIIKPNTDTIYINKKTLEYLNLSIPVSLQSHIHLIS